MVISVQPRHSFTYASAQINVYHADKGYGIPKHEHVFSHATVCHSGSCWVRMEGKEVLIDKNTQPVNLPPNKWHEIEAAEDGTVFENIFSENPR